MKKKLARVCSINAPSKINLHLAIGERRPDGFHGIESLFASLAFGDMLRFEIEAGQKGICQLSMNWEQVPGEQVPGEPVPFEEIPLEKNLVYRALALFRERTGFKSSLQIRIDKRIPTGAGLGGGSSDAASALIALNCLAGTALTREELREMAALLGSDVCFFLTGGTAFVSGRGEMVSPVKSPEGLWVVLAKPPFSSDTAKAFRLLDQVREKAHSEEKLSGKKLSGKALAQALGSDPGNWPFRNDFLPVFLGSKEGEQGLRAGIYAAMLEALRKSGASFSGLSGAGSCCFGVFKSKGAAERAEKGLAGQGNFARLTFFLARRADPVLEY